MLKAVDVFRAQPLGDFDIHPATIAINLYHFLFTLPLLLVFILLYNYLSKSMVKGARYRLPLLVFCAGYQSLIASAPYSDWYARRFDVHNRHVQFVGSALSDRVSVRRKPLTIYWPTSVNDIWFGIGDNGFYSIMQMTGCAFNRGTAVEGYRRAALAFPFEFEELRILGPTNVWLIALADLFPARSPLQFSQEQDLLRLCDDADLDFIVLRYRIKKLYCASDGYYYIYDCKQLRSHDSNAWLHGRDCQDRPGYG